MKKVLYLLIVLCSFFFVSNVNASTDSTYGFTGKYICYKGATELNNATFETSAFDFSIKEGRNVQFRCNSGWTYVVFILNQFGLPNDYYNVTNRVEYFSFSDPNSYSKGVDNYTQDKYCMLGGDLKVCQGTYQTHYGIKGYSFALFGNGDNNYRVLRNLRISVSGEIENLLNYQSTQSSFNSTNSAIDNSTNSINSNSNANKNEIINNQNSQFSNIQKQNEEIQQQNEEQHETSKGIWGTIKSIFSSIVSLPGNLINGVKNLFLPNSECHTSPNFYNGTLEYGSLDNDTGAKISSTTTLRSSEFISVKPNTTYTIYNTNDYANYIYFYDKRGWFISYKGSTGNAYTFTTPANTYYINFRTLASLSQNDLNTKYYIAEESTFSGFSEFGSEVCTGGSFGGWFTNLANSIGGFFTNMVNSVGNFFHDLTTSVGNFFHELLEGILNGLKALFVPSDEQLYEIIDDSKDLSENFGFIGQSVNFFLNIFTSLLGLVNANGCVEMPEFSIGPTSLFDKVTFWNKQVVCLSDNVILSTHIDTIRTVTSIVLVCLFINFAASKFFSVLSKNENNQSSMDAYDLRDRS